MDLMNKTKLVLLLLISNYLVMYAQDHRDCIISYQICNNESLNFGVDGLGINDFGPTNNNAGCIAALEHNSVWLTIKIENSGNLGFTINPLGISDYDFAVFGPDVRCDSLVSPIRCSFASGVGSTGLNSSESDVSEAESGNGFVRWLNVNSCERYYILIDNFSSSDGFQINWTGDATLDCVFDFLELGDDKSICEGDSVSIGVLNDPIESYLWNTGETTSLIYVDTEGLYWLEVTRNGCIERDSIYVSVIDVESIDLGNDSTLCVGDSIILDATSIGATSYLWNTGDTNSIIVVYSSGNYSVNINYPNCSFQDSINVQFNDYPYIDLGNDTTLCEGTLLTLDANSTLATSYLWQDGSISSTYEINQSGIYVVEVFNGFCSYTDSIEVTFISSPSLNIGNDTTLCEGENLLLDAFTEGAISYLWQDGSTSSNFNVSNMGTYYVEVSFDQCIVSDTITVSYNSYPNIDLGIDTTLCEGENLELTAFSPLATDYLWHNGSTSSTINVNVSGVYNVSVSNENCSSHDTIDVTFLLTPEIDLGNDTIICDVATLILDASTADADSYVWNTAETTPIISVNVSGIYDVVVNNSRCVFYDTISVNFGASPIVFLGNDTSLCEGQSIQLNASSPDVLEYTWQDGSNSSTFQVTNEGIYSVEVSNLLCNNSDTIIINYNAIPNINLGDDTVLCGISSFELNSGVTSNGTAIWQDGLISPNYIVDTTGIYSVEVFENGCSNNDEIEIILEQYPSVDLGEDTVLCVGDTLIFDVTSDLGTTYLWQDGSTNPQYIINNSGVYSVVLKNSLCEVSDEVKVSFDDFPNFQLPIDTFICRGSLLELDYSSMGVSNSYLWQDGTTNSTYTVSSEGTYILSVSNSCGSNSDTVFVDYYSCSCEFKAPNVFTPNFDNSNDAFGVFPLCDSLESIEFEIYNRWGELIFTSKSIEFKWDGTLNGEALPMDNYVWYLKYYWRNYGVLREGDKSGIIFLMR